MYFNYFNLFARIRLGFRNLKILWIGKYASDEIFREMAHKGYKDASAQVSQSNMIHAIDEIGISLDTLNAYNVPSNYSEKFIKARKWSRTGNSSDYSVGFRNIKYLSHLFITRNLKKEAHRWASIHEDEEDIIVLVYGMQSSLMTAANEVKKLIPKSKVFLIVPDLPQFMDMAMSSLKKVLKKFDWFKIKHHMKLIDGFILYTKHMAEFLRLPTSKWIVMEGSIDAREIQNIQSIPAKINNSKKISVMYSGKIDDKFGIPELLEAIEKIENPLYEFWFTGTGNAVSKIEEKSKKDSRIKYLGFLPSRDALLQKQKEATMLLNMRLPNEVGSAYCFPSKLFEYMASGRPVLSIKIDGIPDEYFNYLIEIKSPNAKGISETIKYVGSLSEEELQQIGKESRNYVLEKKNSLNQLKKIMEFINSENINSD